MEGMKENICRLCLNFDDDTYSDYSDVTSKGILKSILSKLNFANPSEFVICSKCRASVEDSYQFKLAFYKNDDFIRAKKARLKILGPTVLNHVVDKPKEADESFKYKTICRVCFNSEGGRYVFINRETCDKTIRNYVLSTLPRLHEKVTLDQAICLICLRKIRTIHKFKMDCRAVENKLLEYCILTGEKQIDLNKCLAFWERQKQNANLDCEGDKSTQINEKRPLPEEERSTVSPKKQKSLNSESEVECGTTPQSVFKEGETGDLPPFKFGFFLVCDPRYHSNIIEWLSKVDDLKQRNNWSDLTTMNKVLEKLTELYDLQTWFSDISKTVTWDEWKQKLIDVFPDENDYSTLLRKVLKQKKPADTYVKYYESRMAMLNALNITGEHAVSCLIGSISNVVTQYSARTGNYKAPEELLPFFEAWDSKNPVQTDKVVDEAERLKELQPRRPRERTQSSKIRCSMCRKYNHSARDCPGVRRFKAQIRESRPTLAEESVRKFNSENRSRERGRGPESREISRDRLRTSAGFQKESDRRSSIEARDRDVFNAKLRNSVEKMDIDYGRIGTSNARPDEWSGGSYASRDLRDARSHYPMERDALGDRRNASYTQRQEEIGNYNESTYSARWREDEEKKRIYANGSILPVQDEEDYARRNPSYVESPDEWQSGYVDTDVSNTRQDGQAVLDIDKEALIVKRPEEKEMERKDAPSAGPKDGSSPTRSTSTAYPRGFNTGNYSDRSISNERQPERSDGSYFNKSISSTRLLGSSLGSIFNLSLATRAPLLTSYPSCATTAKPLGLTSSSYFNSGTSHSRIQGYNASRRDTAEELYSRRDPYVARGREPIADNYKKVPPSGTSLMQNYRGICLKCYTVGHNAADCNQFRT